MNRANRRAVELADLKHDIAYAHAMTIIVDIPLAWWNSTRHPPNSPRYMFHMIAVMHRTSALNAPKDVANPLATPTAPRLGKLPVEPSTFVLTSHSFILGRRSKL